MRSSISFAVSSTAIILGLYLIAVQGKGFAQSAVDDAAGQAEQLQRDRAADERQRQFERNSLNNRSPPEGTTATVPDLETSSSDENCIQVNIVSVTGVILLKARAVNEAIIPFEGKCLGLTNLNNILKQLTSLYVKKGYITSRTFLPEQDLSDGSLEIIVVEGSLESVVIDSNPDAYKNQVRTAFPNMVGKPVNLHDIEQGLDQLNRLRSNNAKIELKAGKKPGSSVLSVSRNKTKNWYGTLGFDNLGASSTGEYQSRIDLGFEDVLGLSDQWSFSYQRSMDKHPLFFAEIPSSNTYTGSFSLPYGYWTLAIDGSWSEYNSQIAGSVSDIDTSGLSRSVGVSLSRAIHRDQASITSLSGKLKWKRTENFIIGNRVDVSSRDLSIGSLKLVHSRQFLGGPLLGSVGYDQGLDVFGAFDDDSAPPGSPKGQFRRTNFFLNYIKPLKVGNLTGTYNGQVSAQGSPDLLFGSEQVAYGGYSTVRGLKESVVFGNRGVMTRNEFALRLPVFGNDNIRKLFGQFEAYMAIDFGHVFEENQFQIDDGSLTGATIGLRGIGRHINFDVSYSDIISSSSNLNPAVGASGLFYAKASFSF